MRHHPRADIVAVRLHPVDPLGMRDDRVGVLRGEFPAAWRTAGLGDDRPALRAGPEFSGPRVL